METIQAVIYCLECLKTGKKYVGQTKTHLKKRGKWYKYGINNRFVEHLGAARRGRDTPIAKALREYGKEEFKIEELCRCDILEADRKEAEYIKKYKTLVPYGYNVQESSRFTRGDLYVDGEVVDIEIRGIRKNGILDSVRVLLRIRGRKDRKRVSLHKQNSNETFQDVLERAKEFCKGIIKVHDKAKLLEHSSLYDDDRPWWKYKEKIDSFDSENVERLRIIPFNHSCVRIGIKIKNKNGEQTMTFGGVKTNTEEALKVAVSCVDELSKRHDVEYTLCEKFKTMSATGSCQQG